MNTFSKNERFYPTKNFTVRGGGRTRTSWRLTSARTPLICLRRLIEKNFSPADETIALTDFDCGNFFNVCSASWIGTKTFDGCGATEYRLIHRHETWERSLASPSLDASEFIFRQRGNDCNKYRHGNIFVADLRIFFDNGIPCNDTRRNCGNVFVRFEHGCRRSANFNVSAFFDYYSWILHCRSLSTGTLTHCTVDEIQLFW